MTHRVKSQIDGIKTWLLEGKSITPIEALREFGCFRLSAVIYVLKYEDNMNIKTEIVNNEGKRFAKYSLV